MYNTRGKDQDTEERKMRQTRELWITQVVSPGRCPRPLNDEAPHGALLSLDIVEVFLLPYVSTPPSCSSAFLSLSVIFTSFLYIRSSYINIMCARMRVYYILILFHDAFFIQIRYMHFFINCQLLITYCWVCQCVWLQWLKKEFLI